jgi:hypothetical protein
MMTLDRVMNYRDAGETSPNIAGRSATCAGRCAKCRPRLTPRWCPGVSVFRMDGGRILRVADAGFDTGDDFCALWRIFDLLPEGLGDWRPNFSYR